MQDRAAWDKSLEDSGVLINGTQVGSSVLRFPITTDEQSSLLHNEPLQNGELRLSALVLQHELEEGDVEMEGTLADFVLQDITAFPIDGTRLYIELAQLSDRNQKATRNENEDLPSIDFWVWVATDSVTQIDNLIVIKGKCAPDPAPELNAQSSIRPNSRKMSPRGCLNLFRRHP